MVRSAARKQQPELPAPARWRSRTKPKLHTDEAEPRQAPVATPDALPDLRPATGALRATRGLVLAAASAAIALAGHVLGGGHTPSVPALFVVAALVGAGFVVLADRRRGFTQILFAALASQPVFHIAFSLAEQRGTGADPHGAGPTADQLAALNQHTSTADLVHQLQAALDPTMVAGHVVAAVGIAALTAYCENLLWSLFELVARASAPILQPVPILTAAPALHAAAALVTPPRRQQLARVRTRRGPPSPRA
ncbi:hypothetical protein GCM10027569_69220 [Flindersiella endophytica]